MLKQTYKVRPGFSVILDADNSNHAHAKIYRGGEEVKLTPAQLLAHQHKVEATDAHSQKTLDGLLGQVHTADPAINQTPTRRRL